MLDLIKNIIFLTLILTITFTNCKGQTQKKPKISTKLNDVEIKELGYKIRKEDTVFIINEKLNITKLEKEGVPNGASVSMDEEWKSTTTYNYEEILDSGTYINISGNNLSGYRKIIRKKNLTLITYIHTMYLAI